MYVTFSVISRDNHVPTYIVWFSRIYLYSFVSLFIYIILNLFIAVVLSFYELLRVGQLYNPLYICQVTKILHPQNNTFFLFNNRYFSVSFCFEGQQRRRAPVDSPTQIHTLWRHRSSCIHPRHSSHLLNGAPRHVLRLCTTCLQNPPNGRRYRRALNHVRCVISKNASCRCLKFYLSVDVLFLATSNQQVIQDNLNTSTVALPFELSSPDDVIKIFTKIKRHNHWSPLL